MSRSRVTTGQSTSSVDVRRRATPGTRRRGGRRRCSRGREGHGGERRTAADSAVQDRPAPLVEVDDVGRHGRVGLELEQATRHVQRPGSPRAAPLRVLRTSTTSAPSAISRATMSTSSSRPCPSRRRRAGLRWSSSVLLGDVLRGSDRTARRSSRRARVKHAPRLQAPLQCRGARRARVGHRWGRARWPTSRDREPEATAAARRARRAARRPSPGGASWTPSGPPPSASSTLLGYISPCEPRWVSKRWRAR